MPHHQPPACSPANKAAESPSVARDSVRPYAGRRALLLEDDAYVRDICARSLVKIGFDVVALADTREAWRALEAGGVDLLVTDHHMPGNTGLELIEKLRERQVAIPSILISGNMPLSASAAARKLRGVRTMNKPFSMADLKQAIGEVMGH